MIVSRKLYQSAHSSTALPERGVIEVGGEDRETFLQGLVSNDVAQAVPGRAVWAALTEIPPARTCTYGELAARLGKPNAQRAVGLANGANPVGIVIPCHRVIGAGGKLTGYGGGLPRKRWLLAHEGALSMQDFAADLFARV